MPGRRGSAPRAPSLDEVAAWNDLAIGPGGSVRQTTWWDAPLQAHGVTPSVAVTQRGGAVAGGALVRSTGVRGVPVTIGDCVGGPIVRDDVSDRLDDVVGDVIDQTAAVARRHRMVQLNLQVPGRPDVAAAVVRALGRHGGTVRCVDQPMRAIVKLPRHDDDLTDLLSSHHRRRVRKAAAAGIVVEAVDGAHELRAAYHAIAATASRKDFHDLRPWPALAPAIDAGLERGVIEVLVARVPASGAEVLGAIVLAHVADRTEYLYGGYVDAAAPLGVTHPLHLAAMRSAIARGIGCYDLGQLGRPDAPTGVDRFKLGFGADVTTDPDRIEWVRSPRLGAAITSLRRSAWARKPLARIQSSLAGGTRIDRGGQTEARSIATNHPSA